MSNVPRTVPDTAVEQHGHDSETKSYLRVPSVAFRETRWSLSPDVASQARPDPDRPSPRRQAEFAAGRRAFREAGQILDIDLSAVAVAPTGAPLLPRGVAASLTHTGQYVAAVASTDPRLRILGIDAEPWEPLDARTLAYVSSEQEVAAVCGLVGRDPLVPWGRILFTAKEATFKALSPVGVRPRFSDATVMIAGEVILVTCRTAAGEHRLRGRWSHREAHGTVLTAVWDASIAADRLSVATARL